MPYAEGTKVSPESSQQEIAALVRRYGAEGFMSGWDSGVAVVMFRAHNRQVRFRLDLPTDWHTFRLTPTRMTRSDVAARAALEAEIRRRWRALALAIKAKLECVDTGISTFESEFAMNIVLPDGSTVADHVLPAVAEVYATGRMPSSLLAIEGAAP